MSAPKRIVIVDPQPAAREALAARLMHDSELLLAGVHASLDGARQSLAEGEADVVVSDIWLRGIGGLDALKEFSASTARIVVWSSTDQNHAIADALRAGAHTYVSKYQATDDVIAAIRRVCDGHRDHPNLFDTLPDESFQGDGLGRFATLERLSQREREVFDMLGDGREMSEIAEQLGVSMKTVETYRARIKQKLNIRGRARLVCFAVEWALERRRLTDPSL